MADPLGAKVRNLIRAFHGSPYDFDRFDAKFIGKGEGAQAYGHGLYFAGDESVARSYRDKLIDEAPYQDERQAAADYLAGFGGDREKALQTLRLHAMSPESYGYMDHTQANIIRKANALLKNGADIAPQRRSGRMYEVEIGYPEEALLDLDSPAFGEHKAALLSAAFDAPANKWQRMAIEEIASPTTRSKVAMESLMRAHNVENANKVVGSMQSRAAVANSLFQQGVPGARYFDGDSRAAGEGTRNYVIFPGAEDQIRILRKYGLLAPVATGAAMEQE